MGSFFIGVGVGIFIVVCLLGFLFFKVRKEWNKGGPFMYW